MNGRLELSFPMVDRWLMVAALFPGDNVSILALKGKLVIEKIAPEVAVERSTLRGWGKCLRQVPTKDSVG